MVYGPLQGKMAEFAFDCRNRLIRAGDTEYEYDAENNRTAVITKTSRTEYVINTQPELSQVLQSVVTDNTADTGADATEQVCLHKKMKQAVIGFEDIGIVLWAVGEIKRYSEKLPD